MTKKHSHYYKDVSGLKTIDVYRVLDLFNVTNPCIQHAVKKLLVAGGRGAGKDIGKDIQESIDSLERWKEMQTEGKSVFAECAVSAIKPYEIRPEDVLIDTYIPVNVSSWGIGNLPVGVKLTHKPTDMVVQFHTERSQNANKAKAWEELLRAVEKRVGVKPVVIEPSRDSLQP